MVVHDRGYKRWDGDRGRRVQGVSVIFERGVMTALSGLFKRKVLALLLSFAAYGPFLLGLGTMYLYFYFSSQPEFANQARGMQESGALDMITPNADTMWGYLFRVQKWFALILCVLVGSGLIAEDRRSNALELYLSRPLRLRDYLLGKLAVVGFFLAMVTVVPALILVLVHMMLTGLDPALLPAQLSLLWRTPLAGGLSILVLSVVVLTASSLAQRARNAAILFIGVLAAVEGLLAGMLREVFRDSAYKLLSLDFNVGQLMAWLLDDPLELDPAVPVLRSALVLAAWMTVCLVVIHRRVRPVEVVA